MFSFNADGEQRGVAINEANNNAPQRFPWLSTVREDKIGAVCAGQENAAFLRLFLRLQLSQGANDMSATVSCRRDALLVIAGSRTVCLWKASSSPVSPTLKGILFAMYRWMLAVLDLDPVLLPVATIGSIPMLEDHAF